MIEVAIMITTLKFKLYPQNYQREKLEKTFKAVRFLMNKALRERLLCYELNPQKNFMFFSKKFKSITALKDQYPILKDIDSQALNYALKDLERAYRGYFTQGRKIPNSNENLYMYNSYKTYNSHNALRFVDRYHIRIPKLGNVRIDYNDHLFKSLLIKSARLYKTSDKYYIEILLETVDNMEEELILSMA